MLWRFLLNIQFVNINLVIPKRFFLVAIHIGFIDKSQSMMTNPRHIIDIIVWVKFNFEIKESSKNHFSFMSTLIVKVNNWQILSNMTSIEIFYFKVPSFCKANHAPESVRGPSSPTFNETDFQWNRLLRCWTKIVEYGCYPCWVTLVLYLGWIPRNFQTSTSSSLNCHIWVKITQMISRMNSWIFKNSPYDVWHFSRT